MRFALIVVARSPARGLRDRRQCDEVAPPSLGAARQIFVTVRQPATLAAGLTGAPNQRYLQRRYGPSPSVDRVLTQLAHEHDLRRVEGWPIQSLDVYCEVLTVPDGRDVADVLAALSRDPRVDLAQRMNLFNTQAAKYDDPYLELQSAASAMEVERAHELATGRGVSIAIIDSAVDADHPDLRGRVQLARNLVADHQLARNGEIHGTAIAGIIASAVNNREGIIGVAPDVSIAALRACWAVVDDGLAAQCSTFSLAQALEVALGLQPNVINLSLAGPDDPLLSRLLDRAIERGIVVVTAHPASAESSRRVPVVAPTRADGALVVGARELRLAVHVGSSGRRGSDDDARRQLRVPHGQLARGRAHDGRHRIADGAAARSRCRTHRGDSDGDDDVFGGQRFDQRVPRGGAARRHGVLPGAARRHALLELNSRERLPRSAYETLRT